VGTFLAAPVPGDIAEAMRARAARLGAFGSRLVYFEVTSSTNDVADRLAADGAADGTVVVADAQESGRGRMGHTWFSPPGAGLYVSVVLRPDSRRTELHSRVPDVALASSVSLTAGVALAEGIQAASGLSVSIKWPNDLLVERRKLCGILAEASSGPRALRHIVLGYGINVRSAAYPPDIADRATSLEGELGRPVDRAAVLAETLARLAEWLSSLTAGGVRPMLDRWRALSPSSVGAPVEVAQAGGGWLSAVTAGIDDDGALLVSVAGDLRRVIAGEVRWR
jgi:BirA family biotin operon repressor/biotin-[acetyl-CoA-carboxylase] ligase